MGAGHGGTHTGRGGGEPRPQQVQCGWSPVSKGESGGEDQEGQRVRVTGGLVVHCQDLDFSRSGKTLEGFEERRGLHLVGSLWRLSAILGV